MCYLNLLVLTASTVEVNVKMFIPLIEYSDENNIEMNENLDLEIIADFQKKAIYY